MERPEIIQGVGSTFVLFGVGMLSLDKPILGRDLAMIHSVGAGAIILGFLLLVWVFVSKRNKPGGELSSRSVKARDSTVATEAGIAATDSAAVATGGSQVHIGDVNTTTISGTVESKPYLQVPCPGKIIQDGERTVASFERVIVGNPDPMRKLYATLELEYARDAAGDTKRASPIAGSFESRFTVGPKTEIKGPVLFALEPDENHKRMCEMYLRSHDGRGRVVLDRIQSNLSEPPDPPSSESS